MTFYATQEFQFGETTYYKGDKVPSVTTRLKQLGLVEEIQQLQEVVAELEEIKEDILTEQSSDVEVEVEETKVEETKVEVEVEETKVEVEETKVEVEETKVEVEVEETKVEETKVKNTPRKRGSRT